MENQKLPNATIVLVLGILSVLTICCYGIFSVILGAIGLVLANKDAKLYAMNPTLYTNYSNLKIGKVLNIIGLVLGAVFLIAIIAMVVSLGEEGLMQMQQELLRRQGLQ
ncbi:CCC motif membrane protein [Flavobacterium psychraquaticum]|uniref:CCC motif membrane protein n=1 Tax=Flavobacterium psychraquaticum TaxID=3103958 RepID=UPI002ACD93A6|nr:CCC motif membrane protein [Flavobacterium sp. LB-N7T]